MSNETPSERSDWRDRLDGLEHLPGEPWTGREAAWDSLYERLHEQEDINRRKRASVFWMAAASALLIIGVPLSIRIVHERQRSAEVTSSIRKTTSSPAPAESGKPGERPNLRESAKAVLQTHSNPVMSLPRQAMTEQTPSPIAPPATRDTPSIARGPIVAVVPLTPKKLPIVSINELGMEDNEQPGESRKNDHYFQIKLLNNQAYTGTTASEDTRGQQPGRLGIHIHR